MDNTPIMEIAMVFFRRTSRSRVTASERVFLEMDTAAGGGQREIRRRGGIIVLFVIDVATSWWNLQSRRDDVVLHSPEIIGE